MESNLSFLNSHFWGNDRKIIGGFEMSFVDIALMTVIIAGAVYLLYRSLWKKKGHCMGCDSETCDVTKKLNKNVGNKK